MTMKFRPVWYLAKASAAVERAAHLGVKSAGEELLKRSLEVVPLETGDLGKSGKVTVKGTEAVVSYTSPYAVKQHEDQRLHHDPGRTAKYLEGPMDRGKIGLRAKVGDELRKVMPPVHL